MDTLEPLPVDLYDPILAAALHLLAPPRFRTDKTRLAPILTLLAVAPRPLAPTTTLVALTRHLWFVGPDQITRAYADSPRDDSTSSATWLLNHMVRMSKCGRKWPRTFDYSLAGATCAAEHGNLDLVQWWLSDAPLLDSVIRWTQAALAAAESSRAAKVAAAKRSGLEAVRHAAARNGHFHVLAWWLTQARLPVVEVEPDLSALVASGKLESDVELRGLFDGLMDECDLVPNGVIEAACRANTLCAIEALVVDAIQAKILEWEHIGFRPMDACTSAQGLQWWADHVPRDQLAYLYSDAAVENSVESSLLDWWVEACNRFGIAMQVVLGSALSTAAMHGRLDVLNWWFANDEAQFVACSWTDVVSAAIKSGKVEVVRWCFEPRVLKRFGLYDIEERVEIVIGECCSTAVLDPFLTLLRSDQCPARLTFNCHALAAVSKAGHADVLDSIQHLSRAFPQLVTCHPDPSAIQGASESGHTAVLDWWSHHHPDLVKSAMAASMRLASRSGKVESLQWWRTNHVLEPAVDFLTDTLIFESVTEACANDHGNVLYWWMESLLAVDVSTDPMQYAAATYCHTLVGARPDHGVLVTEYFRWLFSWLPRTSHIMSMAGLAATRLKDHQAQDLFMRMIGATGPMLGRYPIDPEDELRPGYRWWIEHSTAGFVRAEGGFETY